MPAVWIRILICITVLQKATCSVSRDTVVSIDFLDEILYLDVKTVLDTSVKLFNNPVISQN